MSTTVTDAYPTLSGWLAVPCGVACLLGFYGLIRAMNWADRLYNPAGDNFTLSAAQDVFLFTLSAASTYEVSCARPGQWGRPFALPEVELQVRRLPDGVVQRLQPSFWNWSRRTDMEGKTTQRIADFVAYTPGDYELRNPYTARFQAGDQLRILPSTGGTMLPLNLLFLISGLATIGGFVLGMIIGINALQ